MIFKKKKELLKKHEIDKRKGSEITEEAEKPSRLAPTPNPREWAFVSRGEKKRTEAATELMRAREEFTGAWLEYQETVKKTDYIEERLESVGYEEQNRLLRAKAESATLERELKLKEGVDNREIEKLNADIAEQQLRTKKAADRLNEKDDDEIERYKKKKQTSAQKAAIDKETRDQEFRAEVASGFNRAKILDEEEAKEAAKLLAEWESKAISAEEFELRLQNVRDYYAQQRAKL